MADFVGKALGGAIGGGLSSGVQAAASVLNALSGSRQGSVSRVDTTQQALFNYNRMQERMTYNRKEAEKNREWQKMMSDTRYQRAVEDMKKAGINPILAYRNGGAEVPGGATAASAGARIGTDSLASSFGISGLAEGMNQIIGSLENLGMGEAANKMWGYGKDLLNYIINGRNSPSRGGGFGGNATGGRFSGGFGGNASGGSFRG